MTRLFCKDKDPIIGVLKDVLKAELVRVPSEEIRPLIIIEKKGKKTHKRGVLKNILSNKDKFTITNSDFEKKYMADISGEKSNSASIDLGFKILEGFLEGFGISSNIGLKTQFEGVTKISFSFENVYKVFIDNGLLGEDLKNVSIDKYNASAAGYFGKNKSDLIVIDGIITSDNFTVNVDESDKGDFKFNIKAIEDILSASSKLKIEEVNNFSIRFKRDMALPFAFTCVKFELDEHGHILKMPPISKLPTTFAFGEDEFEKTELTTELQFFDFDNE